MIKIIQSIASQNTSKWVVLAIDTVLATVSFLLSCLLVDILISADFELSTLAYPLAIVVIFRVIGFIVSRSYTGVMRYTSIHDAIRIFMAIGISTSIILAVEAIYYFSVSEHLLKPALIVIDAFIVIFLMGSLRLGLRILYRIVTPKQALHSIPVVIYGAGEAGLIVKKSISSDDRKSKKVVAFIDDNVSLQGKSIEGVKIFGSDIPLDKLVGEDPEAELIIAIKNLKPENKKSVIESSLEYGLKVKIIPPVQAWINGEFNPKNIKNVKIEDLLERDPIKLSKAKISSELNDKVILVTGAAGSIGSEIVRQCIAFKPKTLVLLDQAESPLYEIENELKDRFDVKVVIGDICNEARMKRVFSYYKPTYVFHAAAYKHVPLMEDNPYEAISTNVFGTQIIANLSVKYNVKKFVFVSTDKAVNPTNIMGASKRIAEIYVQSLNEKLALEHDNHTRFVTTRFGNVLGSNGSVIPIFKRQIEQGGPITVTHPYIRRFFMTIPEACQLVLEAGVMGRGGEIYIFNMGESVKIVDLAKKMINLSGLEVNKDIKIKFTGLRPGEKLKEELLNNGENTVGTHNPKIMVALVQKYNYLKVNAIINELFEQKDAVTNRSIVRTMKHIVPEYISNNSIYEDLDNRFIES